jgi:hypothetical protein
LRFNVRSGHIDGSACGVAHSDQLIMHFKTI